MEIFIVMSLDKKGSICGLLLGDKSKPYVAKNLLDASCMFGLEVQYIKDNYHISKTFDGNTISCVITKFTEKEGVKVIKHSETYDFE